MMLPRKIYALGTFALLGALLIPISASATFSINLTAGYLRQDANTALNSTATPNGALLLLIASGSANGQTFSNTPNAGQYVSGGDVILGATSLNAFATSGTGKATSNNLSGLTLPATASSSAYIELRWYPSITLAQYNAGATPAAGSFFGAYNPLVTNLSGNTTLNPDGGSAWALAGDGTTLTLNFLTTDTNAAGAKQIPSEGYANFTVPVPEPSAGTLAGLALVIIVGTKSFLRRYKTAER